MKKTTLIIFSFACAFSLVGVGGSWYMLSSISAMHDVLDDGHRELQKEEMRLQNILEVKRQLGRLSAERAELAQYFFHEEDIVRLLEQLEDLARHADVDMDVKEASPMDRSGQKIFRANIHINGPWKNILYFTTLLESLPFHVELSRINLLGGDVSGWSGDITLDLLSFIPKQQ